MAPRSDKIGEASAASEDDPRHRARDALLRAVWIPVQVVIEDDHDSLRQRDSFELLGGGLRRAMGIEHGGNDRINVFTDVL
ncbi:MAG: hypothetical protein ACYDC9_05265 [Dermatophilaceae bacterium]